MTDIDEFSYRELEIVRVFNAPRELVWAAWTEPSQVAAWWGPAGMRTPLESIEMDVRPGGVFRLTMVAEDGSEFPSDMRFTEVREPEVLGFAWEGQRGIGAGSSTITFRDLGDRTELVNHYAGQISDRIEGFMRAGNDQQFDKLEKHLAGR